MTESVTMGVEDNITEASVYEAEDMGILELPQKYYSDYAEFDILNNDSIA